jgi:hypothetical protein
MLTIEARAYPLGICDPSLDPLAKLALIANVARREVRFGLSTHWLNRLRPRRRLPGQQKLP